MKENSAHGFTEGSEVPKEQDAAHSFEDKKDANLCPVMSGYYCFDRACGIDHEKQCLMINPKDKIYVDGSKAGDYIQQHVAFRREMERNYAKMEDELTRLRSELQQERELRKELVECIESYVDLELFANPKPIESLIKKAKLK